MIIMKAFNKKELHKSIIMIAPFIFIPTLTAAQCIGDGEKVGLTTSHTVECPIGMGGSSILKDSNIDISSGNESTVSFINNSPETATLIINSSQVGAIGSYLSKIQNTGSIANGISVDSYLNTGNSHLEIHDSEIRMTGNTPMGSDSSAVVSRASSSTSTLKVSNSDVC